MLPVRITQNTGQYNTISSIIMYHMSSRYLWYHTRLRSAPITQNTRQSTLGMAHTSRQYLHLRYLQCITIFSLLATKKALPVYFRYDDQHEKRCAIVIREFEVEGHYELPPELMGTAKRRIRAMTGKTLPTKKCRQNTTTSGNITNKSCICNGGECSKHGVVFVTCITECIPVGRVPLAFVARECVFATRKIDEMTPSDKRFLIYYYYATTVYQFHGRGNRVELPECIKRAVRSLHPNASN